jgi:hypothetical protein
MDSELLRWLYHRLLHDPTAGHTGGCTYSLGLITLIYFYAVLLNHSPLWACQRRNWPIGYRRLRLPSYSQFNRRLKWPQTDRLIGQINDELRRRLPQTGLKFVDGKPLVVSGFSKDHDATVGQVPGGFARGYKVHLLVDSLGRIEAFDVTGLHAGEPTVMRKLLQDHDLTGLLIRGDSNYDSNPLYRRVADNGGRLIASRKKPFTGIGHHPQHPDRLRAIAELEQSKQTLREHRRIRAEVERRIGHLTNLPCGLWALPNFIRRRRRVRRWVAAKIVLLHLHRILKLTTRSAA